MAKKRKGYTAIDVSDFIDDRGRRVNTDIPEDERKRGSASKSNAKKRLKDRKLKAELAEQRRRDEEEEKKGIKKKKKRKKAESDPVTPGSKKKKKRTVGELLKEGKTDKAKKKMSKQLAVIGSVASEIMSGEHDIAEFIPATKLSSESEFLDTYQHIFTTLGNIIRNLEQQMSKENANVNSKDVYALMTMYSQMRETIADMRSIKDMSEQAEIVAREVFDPAMKASGDSLVNVFYKFSAIVRAEVKDGVAVEKVTERFKKEIAAQAKNLQDGLMSSRGKILEVLSGVI